MNPTTQEGPILFTGAMVNAILEGRKTQTRRIMKPQPELQPSGHLLWKGFSVESGDNPGIFGKYVEGDRLWVRETWHPATRTGCVYEIEYKADGSSREITVGFEDPTPTIDAAIQKGWRPSIFMPRWASRIALEICSVRVERLQEITEEDVIAEGVKQIDYDGLGCYQDYYCGIYCATAVSSYQSLWSKIHGPESWEASPWVWVIGFRRIPE